MMMKALPNFIKREHTRKGEKKKQGARWVLPSNYPSDAFKMTWSCQQGIKMILTNKSVS
jgi:hypothetical protein